MSHEAHTLMAEIHDANERRKSDGHPLDVIAAQETRRFVAIREAVKHLRDINTFKCDKTIDEIADELEKANQVRQDDAG